MSPLEFEFGPRASVRDIVRRLIARGAPLAIAALAGCDDTSAPAARTPVSLSFAARRIETAAAASSSPRTRLDLQASDENNTLVLTSVELVFDEIETGPRLVSLPLGGFDGAPFQYAASLDNEIEMDFRPALEVGEAGVNITVNLDVLSWFRDADGALIDPRTAVPGQPDASVVSANIWRSLAVFEDDDHDGYDDHGGHGGHGNDD